MLAGLAAALGFFSRLLPSRGTPPVRHLPLALPHLNEQLEAFSFEGFKITNYEMESSAIYGLSALLGHEALTVCLLIANRMTRGANESYHGSMERLVEAVLNHLIR